MNQELDANQVQDANQVLDVTGNNENQPEEMHDEGTGADRQRRILAGYLPQRPGVRQGTLPDDIRQGT